MQNVALDNLPFNPLIFSSETIDELIRLGVSLKAIAILDSGLNTYHDKTSKILNAGRRDKLVKVRSHALELSKLLADTDIAHLLAEELPALKIEITKFDLHQYSQISFAVALACHNLESSSSSRRGNPPHSDRILARLVHDVLRWDSSYKQKLDTSKDGIFMRVLDQVFFYIDPEDNTDIKRRALWAMDDWVKGKDPVLSSWDLCSTGTSLDPSAS